MNRSLPISLYSLLLILFFGALNVAAFAIRFAGSGSPDPIRDIYGLMWLDFLNLSFLLSLGIALFVLRLSQSQRHLTLLLLVGTFGVVALRIIYHQTPFPDYAYWGDQKFHIAAILKYMKIGLFGDYYYKELPVFYPPLYEWTLAAFGRTFGVHAHALISVGYKLLAIAMPFLLYLSWSRVVSRRKAVAIALCSMIIDIGGSYMLVMAPYAFASNALFIPWWIGYVEASSHKRSIKRKFREWLFGGLIGAALFMTYFYPFFMLPFFMFAKRILDGGLKWRIAQWFESLKRPISVIAGAALISSFYWFPALLSVLTYGGDRSRGDWFHSGTPGLYLPSGDFSWLTVLYLASLGILLIRFSKQIARSLLAILLGSVCFLLIASALGTFDLPLNFTKAREFLWSIVGPVVGLALIDLYARTRKQPALRIALAAVLAMLLITFTGGTARYARSDSVAMAKRAVVPDYGLSSFEIEFMRNKVLLSSEEEIFAFVPAYGFMSVNEHYSHPAARFAQRYDFLRALQHAGSAEVTHLALRENIFSRIDAIMPEVSGDGVILRASLSAYPNGLAAQEMRYPLSWFTDSTLYTRFGYGRLFLKLESAHPDIREVTPLNPPISRDEILRVDNLRRISQFLTSDGQEELNRMSGQTLSTLSHSLVNRVTPFSRRIVLTSASSYEFGDSLALAVTYRVNRQSVPGSNARIIWRNSESDQIIGESWIRSLDVGFVERMLFVVPKGIDVNGTELECEVAGRFEGRINLSTTP